MARAIEKGATHLDKLCHKFYDEPKGRGNKTDYVCRLCGGPLETYYCEERLYLVQCADCGTFSLVKTANPEDAARVTLARPTLTPPNEPLTCEGCKFEYEATDEAMCEQCIRSPAYRDYYHRPPEGEEGDVNRG